MKPFATSLFLFCALSAFSFAATPIDSTQSVLRETRISESPGALLNTQDFFSSIAGSYVIDLSGGTAPHPGADKGRVTISGSQAVAAFQFCQPTGVCDPNVKFFPFASTEVYEQDVAAGDTLYTWVVGDNKFTWENKDGQITYTNPQYQLSNGQAFPLVIQLHKAR